MIGVISEECDMCSSIEEVTYGFMDVAANADPFTLEVPRIDGDVTRA